MRSHYWRVVLDEALHPAERVEFAANVALFGTSTLLLVLGVGLDETWLTAASGAALLGSIAYAVVTTPACIHSKLRDENYDLRLLRVVEASSRGAIAWEVRWPDRPETMDGTAYWVWRVDVENCGFADLLNVRSYIEGISDRLDSIHTADNLGRIQFPIRLQVHGTPDVFVNLTPGSGRSSI